MFTGDRETGETGKTTRSEKQLITFHSEITETTIALDDIEAFQIKRFTERGERRVRHVIRSSSGQDYPATEAEYYRVMGAWETLEARKDAPA